MGQSLSNQLDELRGDVLKEAHTIKELLNVTHEEFLSKIQELNNVCTSPAFSGSRKLFFYIKEGSDATFLWKQTVRIACMRSLQPSSEIMEDFKVLTLRQFMLISANISCLLRQLNGGDGAETSAENSSSMEQTKPLSTSMILDQFTCEAKADTEECIICMERKPEVTLPCAHAYCMFCIEQWNVSHKTCPVCRATVENTDESWVTPDIPENSEVKAEIRKALNALTEQLSDDD